MSDPVTTTIVAGAALAGLGIASFSGLRGWQGWLALRRLELEGRVRSGARAGAGEMIEVADLKERVRKLEALAAVVDL